MNDKSTKKQKGNVEAPKVIQIEDLENFLNAFENRINKKISIVEDQISNEQLMHTNLRSELLESLKESCVGFVKDQFRNRKKKFLVR